MLPEGYELEIITDPESKLLKKHIPEMIKFYKAMSNEEAEFIRKSGAINRSLEHLTGDALDNEKEIKEALYETETARSAIVFVLHGNELAASCLVDIYESDYSSCYIGAVYVSKKHRRVGVGRGLIESLLAMAKENELTHCTLSAFIENKPAVNLYEGVGFKSYVTAYSIDL